MHIKVLELFNVIVTNMRGLPGFNADHAVDGFVTDFLPTAAQLAVMKSKFKAIDCVTLFSKDERMNSTVGELLTNQILHYADIYRHKPGQFDLTVGGTILTMNFVHGVTAIALSNMVRTLIYSNAPIKDASVIINIVKFYNVEYDINKVANNEVRCMLFDVDKDVFVNGDDAVRYMCFAATGTPLLIKSQFVIAAVAGVIISRTFLEKHVQQLAAVFNRHKRIIVAAKKPATKTVINKISRLSKTLHVPMVESINKRFIACALNNSEYGMAVLGQISLRDKFKYLNLLEYKKEQLTVDLFYIRNGKVFLKGNRKQYELHDITRVLDAVISSIDLQHLAGKNILLDAAVDYGLPISRKQSVGQLPFGSEVSVNSSSISAGMYWKNEWGATDLDLSTIDKSGDRVGWGQYSGYDNGDITYSGDIVNAPNGAVEFMTSTSSKYGLFVNIYNGKTGAEMELIVGSGNVGDDWITNPIIREKYKLNSSGSIVGFVKGNNFVVYNGRVSNKQVSGYTGTELVVQRGLGEFWTVSKLLDKLGIKYDTTDNGNTLYDYDLTYTGFAYNKLEALLFNNAAKIVP